MTERQFGKQLELRSGRLVATTNDGQEEVVHQSVSKDGRSYAGKVVPRGALDSVRPALRFVYEDDPDESFGVSQFSDNLVEIDMRAPDNLGGREEEMDATIRNGCARFQAKSWTAQNVADYLVDRQDSIQTDLALGSRTYEEVEHIKEDLAATIIGFFPGNSPNRKIRKKK